MRLIKLILLLALGLNLGSCGRSKDAQFYMLNPVPPQAHPSNRYQHLLIGIDEIYTPAFAEKPQMLIYDSSNEVKMEEYHQWAEALDKNIKRVIETNLTTLLPGAIVERSPWDIKFKPNYNLQVTISEIKIDMNGNSSLRAEYLIYHHEQLIKKYDKYYHIKIPVVTVENLVRSMNTNLSHLTQDIAKTFTAQ